MYSKGMGRLLSVVDIRNKLKGRTVVYVAGYVNSRLKATFKCLVCNQPWSAVTNNVLRGSGCPKCSGRGETMTNTTFDLRAKGKYITRLGDIKGTAKPCKFKCDKCSFIWTTQPSYIVNCDSGCPRCKNTLKLTDKKIDSSLIGRDILRIGKLKGNNKTKIEFKCLKCENVWMAY